MQYRYINKHFHMGTTNMSLILYDTGSPVETRLEKSFKMPPEEIDAEFLYQVANDEIIRLQNAPVDVPVDQAPAEEVI